MASNSIRLRFGLGALPLQLEKLKQNNPDGWGLGWIRDGRALVDKRALPVTGAPIEQESWLEGEGTQFIGHIRRGTRGGRTQKNSHPFVHADWLFAHSGHLFPKLEAALRRRLGSVELASETDSEVLFRWLLKNHLPEMAAHEWFQQALKPLVEDGEFSSLNFILAHEAAFYAFRLCTRSTSFYSLYHQRWATGTPLLADSAETFTRIECQGLEQSDAVLVCSETLDDGGWTALAQGELLTVSVTLATETCKLF
jgi:predicted glutamine amidotransferase